MLLVRVESDAQVAERSLQAARRTRDFVVCGSFDARTRNKIKGAALAKGGASSERGIGMRRWEYVLLALAVIFIAVGVVMMIDGSVVGNWAERTGVATILGVTGIGLWASAVARIRRARKSAPVAR